MPLKDVTDTLEVYQGSLYVNDFNRFGRTWQVIVQAESPFRSTSEDDRPVAGAQRAGQDGAAGFAGQRARVNGPLIVTRYNMYPAAFINGSGAPGISSGEAIALMEKLAKEHLPRTMSFEWTETAYLELQAGNTAMIIFGFSVAWSSWCWPHCTKAGRCRWRSSSSCRCACSVPSWAWPWPDMDINILTQVGFVMLVGLASKNAILIVEFAKVQREHGVSRREATLEACRLRLRPIVMTSLAFILGVVPLMISHGAGAEMRRTLGTAVFSGMLGVTLVGLLLTPVFFSVVNWLSGTRTFNSRSANWSAPCYWMC